MAFCYLVRDSRWFVHFSNYFEQNNLMLGLMCIYIYENPLVTFFISSLTFVLDIS